jgi:hypothetical protein
MTQTSFMRLSCLDNEISFLYLDTEGNQVTFRFEIPKKRWFPHSFNDPMSYEYLVEGLVNSPNNMQIIQLSRTLGNLYQVGGDTDNGATINSLLQIPSLDGGDERTQKLPTDWIVDSDQAGVIATAQFYNNNSINSPVVNVTSVAARQQNIVNISSVPGELALYRNISIKLSWSGGPDGPRIYAVEPAFYIQPFLSTRVLTQFISLAFPGWKTHKRLYAGLISTAPVTFTIQQQNGVSFVVTIPSTGGQFMIQEQMLPQAIKFLSAAYMLDGGGVNFALFTDDFTIETKQWVEDSYISLAVFKT